MKSKLLKGALTVFGAVLVSTLGIFASDSLRGIDRDLVGLVGSKTEALCREGAVPLRASDGIICVDEFEAKPSASCPHQNPQNIIESEENASAKDCYASSKKEGTPWRFISLPQAQRMCAASGKRLPTSDEWYGASLGTDPSTCTINSPNTAISEKCLSTIGARDMVGNVWEWVDETVVNASFDGRSLPEEGYVSAVDASGVSIETAENPNSLYGDDYFWSEAEGVFGMIRGGFYGSRSDAGIYTVNAAVPTTFASQGVGFRCVQDVF